MENEEEKAKKKQDNKLKVIKDLTFLLKKDMVRVNSRTAKYLLQEGQGDVISQIAEQFTIVYNCTKYDYEGRYVNTWTEKRHSKHDTQYEPEILNCLMTMRVKEKAWFNICSQPLFKNQLKGDQQMAEDIELLDDSEEEEPELEEVKCEGQQEQISLQKTGEHYEIVLERIEYKNCEDLAGKRKVFEQKKQEGRQKFLKGEYGEAIRIYKFLTDITSSYSKKLYSEIEIIELQGMNKNSQFNFMKSYFKMVENKEEIPQNIESHAESVMESLSKSNKGDHLIYFLHAKWLLKGRYLNQAYQEAEKSFKCKPTAEAGQLMKLIRLEKENKGKIKVAVNDLEHK